MAVQNLEPFNIKIPDIDQLVEYYHMQRVTSSAIHAASSMSFDPEGLFSEEIFGSTEDRDERLQRFGYIDLNCSVLQPILYLNLVKLGSLYQEILAGTTYAIFDPDIKDFVKMDYDPDNEKPAETGFSFFMRHVKDISFQKTPSNIREGRIELFEKYRDKITCSKLLVIPAGMRDVEQEANVLSQDDINRIYAAIIAYSAAIPKGAQSSIYDSVRFNLQKKVVEIYEYLKNIVDGKKGYILGSFGTRKIAGSTRNVISAATYCALTPDDPRMIKPDETKLGLYQCMANFRYTVVHNMRTCIVDPIFNSSTNRIAVTNPERYTLEYIDISNEEYSKYATVEAIKACIVRFKNADIRHYPMTVYSTAGKKYYWCLIYDSGDEISLFRNIEDLENLLGFDVDRSKIRPLTWVEAFYMVTYKSTRDRSAFITRYPAIYDGSCYPSRVHVTTTTESRIVHLRDTISGELTELYPEFPIIPVGEPPTYSDTTVVHASKLKGLGGDYDGDTVSVNSVNSQEAIQEINDYLNHPKSLVGSDGKLLSGANTDNIGWTFMNLSKAS